MREKWASNEKTKLAVKYKECEGSIKRAAIFFPKRTEASIRTMCRDMGLRTRMLWTSEKENELKELFPRESAYNLEKKFKLKFHNIEVKANAMGLFPQ